MPWRLISVLHQYFPDVQCLIISNLLSIFRKCCQCDHQVPVQSFEAPGWTSIWWYSRSRSCVHLGNIIGLWARWGGLWNDGSLWAFVQLGSSLQGPGQLACHLPFRGWLLYKCMWAYQRCGWGGVSWWVRSMSLNSLWPSYSIWWHRSWSALAQVMTWCLITWTNVDFSFVRFCGIHLRVFVRWVPNSQATIFYNEVKSHTVKPLI